MNLRLTKMEVQELRLWGYAYKEKQEETGLKFEEDQKKILTKLNTLVGKDYQGNLLEDSE